MITSLNTYKEKIRLLESSFSGITENFNFFLKKSLQHSESSIILKDDLKISSDEIIAIENFINLSLKKIPFEYILKEAEFYGRNFYVDPRVLIPRNETELLIEILIEDNVEEEPRIIDLGTGSGCIGISIALEIPKSKVIGLDSSIDAIDVATINKDLLKASNFNLVKSDWLSEINENNFDVIISNPPYIDLSDPHLEHLKHEPQSALIASDNGLSDFKKISSQAYPLLKGGGILMFEHGYNQSDEVTEIMKLNKFNKIQTYKDYQLHPRITIGIK